MSFVIFNKTIHINKLKEEFDKKNFIRDNLFKNLEKEFFVEKKIIFEDNKNNFKKNKTIEDLNEKLNINDIFKKNLNEEKTIEKANLIKKKSENYLSQSLRYLENYYNSSINILNSIFKKKEDIKKEEKIIDEKMQKLEETSLQTIDQYKKSSEILLELSKNLKN